MFYKKYCSIDVINGEGLHCSLIIADFYKESTRDYKNSPFYDSNNAYHFIKNLEDKIITDLSDETVPRRGFSIAGYKPLHSRHLNALYSLITRVRFHCPDKQIWLWIDQNSQSLTFEQKEVAQLAHVIIDNKSPFVFHDPSCYWRTSSNVKVDSR